MKRFAIASAMIFACASKPAPSSGDSAGGAEPPSKGDPQPAGDATPDDPRVSRSAGEAGGVVLLWPRIIPADQAEATSAIAGQVQAHMKALVERTLPGRTIDVRPEPERTCPQAGCYAVALGALILRQGDACAVVGFVMPAGGATKNTTLVPWTGELTLKHTEIPFRGFPESEVSIKDFHKCGDLPGSLAAHESDVAQALKTAAM